jgi:hypothetical protein
VQELRLHEPAEHFFLDDGYDGDALEAEAKRGGSCQPRRTMVPGCAEGDEWGTVESNSLPCARCGATIPGFDLYTHVPGKGAVCRACTMVPGHPGSPMVQFLKDLEPGLAHQVLDRLEQESTSAYLSSSMNNYADEAQNNRGNPPEEPKECISMQTAGPAEHFFLDDGYEWDETEGSLAELAGLLKANEVARTMVPGSTSVCVEGSEIRPIADRKPVCTHDGRPCAHCGFPYPDHAYREDRCPAPRTTLYQPLRTMVPGSEEENDMRHEMETATGVVVKPAAGDWYYLHGQGAAPTDAEIDGLVTQAKERLAAEARTMVPGSEEETCPGCGQPMSYHDSEGFCL